MKLYRVGVEVSIPVSQSCVIIYFFLSFIPIFYGVIFYIGSSILKIDNKWVLESCVLEGSWIENMSYKSL